MEGLKDREREIYMRESEIYRERESDSVRGRGGKRGKEEKGKNVSFLFDWICSA